MKKSLALTAIGLAIVASGAVYIGLGACGWLDRYLGRSGCLGSYTIANLSSLGSTMAVDRDGRLIVAGGDHRASAADASRSQPHPQVVTLDLANGNELDRVPLDFSGLPDQLRLSPVDDHIAVTCNSIYVCDLADPPPGAEYAGASLLGLFAPDGALAWSQVITRDIAQPSAEGRAFDLAFAEDGATVVAGPVAFATADGTPREDSPPAMLQSFAVDSADSITVAGVPRPLGLPEGYVPFTRLQVALSADAGRLAALSRRFSGPGQPRAILTTWDTASGRMLARHEIETDLAPALAWHPDGSVLVAAAGPQAIGAGTQVRIYAGDMPL